MGSLSSASVAKSILDFHRKGLRARRYRDLTAEKYLLHIDGEGLSQFLDLLDGTRLAIPFSLLGTSRQQENILRPVVDHMVAYHTAQPFSFVTEPKDDRRDKERALVDQVWANYLATRQRLNSVAAAALYMACPYGHTPIHAFWRNDSLEDVFEPAYSGQTTVSDPKVLQFQPPLPGMIDFFVGDPWATVYHSGSKRTSVPMYTYERVLPAELVRRAFSHVKGIETLEGSDRLASASRYVRTVRNWMVNAAFVHGFGGMVTGEGGDELIALLCQEVAPNVDPRFPGGRCRLLALKGAAEVDPSSATSHGEPVLLHDGPLPGGCLSHVRIYSAPGGRQDDVHGKPFVADLDDDQVELNQALTERKAYLRRATNAPLVTEEGLDQDTDVWEQDAHMELEPGTTVRPFFLEYPHGHIETLESHIRDLRSAIYTKGGYQAASRGEYSSGQPAAAIVALSKLDDSVHGPTNRLMREAMEDLMGISWSLMQQFGDVPWIVDNVGAEHAHLVGRYVDRAMLSKRRPTFRLISGYGATPEARAQQLLQMVQMKGSDGEPLLTTKQFKASWPDKTTYPEHEDPLDVRQRRPKVINAAIRTQTEAMLAGMGQQGADPATAELLVPAMEEAIRQMYPILPDDHLPLHVQELGNITQDETEDRIVRRVAGLRQAQIRALIQQMQMMEAAQAARSAPPPAAGPSGPRAPALPNGQPANGEAAAAQTRPAEVRSLTRQAQGELQ